MGEDTTGMVTSVSKIREEFKALSGVDIMQDENTFKSTTQIVLELADAWEHMTDIQRAALGELAGGKRGAQSLFAAVQNADIIRKTIADANGAAVGSVDRQMAVWESSIDASLQRFHVAFQELSTDLINSDAIKGIVDFGTVLLRIIDELVKHIGVLGTALTGLGVAKIFSTAVNGAKNVSDLSTAVSLFFDAIKGGSGKLEAFNLLLGEVGAGATGAGSALGTMFSTLGGFIASPAGWVTGAVAAVVAAGTIAYNIRKKQEEELRKQATATTEKWGDDKSSVDDFKRQYTELNDQLKNVNLTESERIGIKQQLLDLQNQISAKYGADAGQLDLINGKYETQLGLISQITEKEAHRNLQNNREAYQQSIDEMTKDRTYTLFSNGSGSDLMKKIEMAYVQNGFKDQGDLSFDFTGDVTEADKNIRALMDRLEQLKATANDTEKQFIDSVIGATSKLLAKNNEILDANQANYQAYLEQSLYDDGYGDELAKYSKLVKEYNEALAGDDVAYAYKKRSEMLAYYRDNIDGVFEGTQYEDFFTGVTEQIDTASEKMMDWQDIVDDGTTYATNGLAKYTDIIRKTVGDIKKLKLDGVDIQAILGDPNSAMYKDMAQLAKLWNPDINLNNPDDLQLFSDFLMKVVYGADAFGGSVDLAKSEFDDFMKSASASIETVEKANAALVNSFGNKGLSMGIDAETGAITGDVATIIDAYKDLKGYDAKVLFERTADGINVNADALRALQAEQEATVKADFIRRIAEAQREIGKAGTVEGKKYWEDQLETVRLLSSAYDGATSAYQKWIDAQKMTSPGSKYDAIATNALKQAKEYYDKGLVGNPVFKSIAQLFTNEDLSLASNEEITKAYEDGVEVVKKYFTEGSEGAEAFADKLVELNLAKKEGEEYDFSESGINTTELANELGISVDLVEAAFGKLQEHGWDINFINDDQLTKLGELGEKAESARERLAELADEEGKVGGTDISSVIDIDVSGIDTIDECNEAIEQINEAKANAEVDSEEYQYLDSLLEDITLMRDVLEQETKPTVDDSSLVSAEDTYNSLIERIEYLANVNTSVPGVYVDIQNDEQVRELADTLLNMDDEEIKAKLGIEGIDTVDGIIEKLKQEHIDVPVTANTSGMQVQAETSGTINYTTGTVEGVGAQTAVLNYITGTIPPIPTQTALVDYSTNKIEKVPNQEAKINYSNGYIEDVPDQSATINYTASISGLGALPQDGEHRTIYINTVERYKGTVTKSAFQAMSNTGSVTSGSSHANGTLGKVGLKHDETALINELGSEIVVRPSEDSWMIFNDGKPTFAPLKKGDIKIYCVHVQKCA